MQRCTFHVREHALDQLEVSVYEYMKDSREADEMHERDATATKCIESIVFTPCGGMPEQGDFLSAMRHNLAGLG